MFIIKDLRLNRFDDVIIPSAKDLYSKFGFRNISRKGSVGKDGNFTVPVNRLDNMSEIDSLSYGQRLFDSSLSAKETVSEETVSNDDTSNDLPKGD